MSASRSRSEVMWVEKKTPRPPRSMYSLKVSSSCLRMSGSRPLVGSSMMSSSARWESARASEYFMRIPLERVRIFCRGFKEKRSSRRQNSCSSQEG